MARAFDVPVPERMTERLTTACEIDVKLMMPDGCLPDINDGRMEASRKLLEPKLSFVREEKAETILWAASGGTRGTRPEYLSTALPYSCFFKWMGERQRLGTFGRRAIWPGPSA